MEILINAVIAVISIFITWLITDFYYKKALNEQTMQWEKVESELLNRLNATDPLNKLILYERRIASAIQDYRRIGTPKLIIDTFYDLSLAEKEKMYDDVLLRVKGRKARSNPYK